MMYVKTTKGVYELTPNRAIEIIEAKENKHDELVEYYHYEQNPMKRRISRLYGEVIETSENLNELIVEVYKVNPSAERIFYDKCPTLKNLKDMKDLIKRCGYRIVGVAWIGDDLVKVAEWDNEKGEWKLYER